MNPHGTPPTDGLVAVGWHALFCFFIASPMLTLMLGFSVGYMVLTVIGFVSEYLKNWRSLRRLKAQIRRK